MHVVKNSLFRLAVKEAGVADLGTTLTGQLAVVTGQRDVSSAAKVVKTFSAEFDKPKIRFGYLKNQRLETADIVALADLPSIEVLRAKLLGRDHGARPPNWRRSSTRRPRNWSRVLAGAGGKGDASLRDFEQFHFRSAEMERTTTKQSKSSARGLASRTRPRLRTATRLKGKVMADIAALVEQLGKLTVIEAADLVKQLETAWGVTAAAPAAAAARRRRRWRRRPRRGSEDEL